MHVSWSIQNLKLILTAFIFKCDLFKLEFINVSLAFTSLVFLGYQKGTGELCLCEFQQIYVENQHDSEEFPFSCVLVIPAGCATISSFFHNQYGFFKSYFLEIKMKKQSLTLTRINTTSEFQKTQMKQAKEGTKNKRDWTRLFQKVTTHCEYV